MNVTSRLNGIESNRKSVYYFSSYSTVLLKLAQAE